MALDEIILAIVALAIVFEVVGIWALVIWTRSGAIRREANAILDKEITINGQIMTRLDYMIAKASASIMAQVMTFISSEEGAAVLGGLAQRAGASAIESLKAYMKGMGLSNEDIKNTIATINKLGGFVRGGAPNAQGEQMALGGIVGQNGGLNIMGLAAQFMGMMGGGGQSAPGGGTVAPAGEGRIGP